MAASVEAFHQPVRAPNPARAPGAAPDKTERGREVFRIDEEPSATASEPLASRGRDASPTQPGAPQSVEGSDAVPAKAEGASASQAGRDRKAGDIRPGATAETGNAPEGEIGIGVQDALLSIQVQESTAQPELTDNVAEEPAEDLTDPSATPDEAAPELLSATEAAAPDAVSSVALPPTGTIVPDGNQIQAETATEAEIAEPSAVATINSAVTPSGGSSGTPEAGGQTPVPTAPATDTGVAVDAAEASVTEASVAEGEPGRRGLNGVPGLVGASVEAAAAPGLAVSALATSEPGAVARLAATADGKPAPGAVSGDGSPQAGTPPVDGKGDLAAAADALSPAAEPVVADGQQASEPVPTLTGTATERPAGAGATPAAPDAPKPAPAPPLPQIQAPLAAVPIEIALKAAGGINRFEIRLDPAELGRVDVRLEIEGGEVRAQVVVDRVETLALLQRDARTLERAFEQIGLKAGEGIDLSLRDPGGERDQRGTDTRGGERDQPSRRGSSGDDDRRDPFIRPATIAESPIIRTWRGSAGIDVRV